jgi:drug/metabolite transporter (DMT)-like permease
MIVLMSAMVLLQVVASICYPIAKFGLMTIEPFTFAFYRYLIASIFLLSLTLLRKHTVPIERADIKRIVLLGILIIPLNQTTFLVGQSLTGAGHGAFLFATTPVFVFVLALLHLKERLVWRRAVGIVMAMAGVMTILSSAAIDVGLEYLAGDLIILVSVTAWAYYTILGKNLVRKYGALRVTAYALASGSAIYFPFGLYMAARYDYSQATAAAWGSVLYMALGLSGFVYIMWYWLLKYLDASRIAVYHNIQPVIATVLAVAFLGETLTVPFVVGGLLAVAGVVVSEI